MKPFGSSSIFWRMSVFKPVKKETWIFSKDSFLFQKNKAKSVYRKGPVILKVTRKPEKGLEIVVFLISIKGKDASYLMGV